MKQAGRPDQGIVVAAIAIVVLAFAAGAAPLVPSAALDEPSESQFSAHRAFAHIEQIATAPRPIGSPANERAREIIVRELERIGLRPERQVVAASDYFGTNGGASIDVVNIVARIDGTDAGGAVALVGHYDTHPASPGANDNASAVAVLLETARAIRAGPALRNDVILLFTDGEEPAPRFGSTAFVAEHPWAREVGAVVNLEALGGSGPSTIVEVSGREAWIISEYAAAVSNPAAYSYLTATMRLIGGSNTDFAPFQDAGVPGLELAYVRGSPIYHLPADAPDRVGIDSLQHHGASALAMVRRLAGADLSALDEEDDPEVYFTIGRASVVRYPGWWTLVAVLLGTLALVAALWRSGAVRRSLRGAAAVLAIALATALLAVTAWTALAGLRQDMGVHESYLYLGGLVVLAWGVGSVILARTGAPTGELAHAGGVAIVWLGLALVCAVTLPEIGYLLAWPALACGIAILFRRRSPGGWADIPGFALVTASLLVLCIPAIDTFYQFAQPRPGNLDSQILWIIVLPALMISLATELVRAMAPRRPMPSLGTALDGEAVAPAWE